MLKWLKQYFCNHEPYGGLRSEKVSRHRKRHYYKCKKCQHKEYVD